MKRPPFKNHGIQAKTLLELVENTAPFLFSELQEKGSAPEYRYIRILNDAKARVKPGLRQEPDPDADLWSYFELAIAAHFATVGTFVPTDVDLAIRQKLWSFVHNETAFEKMWDLVLEFSSWNEDLVSARTATTAPSHRTPRRRGSRPRTCRPTGLRCPARRRRSGNDASDAQNIRPSQSDGCPECRHRT